VKTSDIGCPQTTLKANSEQFGMWLSCVCVCVCQIPFATVKQFRLGTVLSSKLSGEIT